MAKRDNSRRAPVIPIGMATERRPSVPPPTRDTRSFPQTRAKKTYATLLQAAGDVFAEMGFDAAQTPDIAARAGVSVGTFYRYFADKRQVFIELAQDYLERAFHATIGGLSPDAFMETRTPADRRAALEQVIEVLFQSAAEKPAFHRVFVGMALRDNDVARLRSKHEQRARDAMARLIQAIAPVTRIPDAHAAAEVIQIAAREVAVSAVDTESGATAADVAARRRALTDMIYRYLFTGG
jgi:AcrR family transcriptional regulator